MPIERERRLRRSERVQWTNAGTNVGLAATKLTIGLHAGSPALVAHGVENLSDLLGNGVAWLGHRLARRPPDEDHHYGHGHFEALATVAIGLLILAGGATVVWRTIAVGVDRTDHDGALLAVAVAFASALVCEAVARYTRRVAEELESPLLAALARDKRSDALTSVGVLAGVGGSLAGLSWAEPPVAVLLGGWICVMGVRSVLDGLDVLSDRVADPGLRAELGAIAAGVPGVAAVQEVRVHPLGSTYRVELGISVDGELSVREGHAIAHAVERAIQARRPSAEDVHVHVNPAGEPAEG